VEVVFVFSLRSTVVFLFASVLTHAAVITVNPTVTSIAGGMYQYAYSISYTGTDDAFLIDISVPKDPAAITNLTVPSGFTDQFDSVNGLVSFVENSSTFTATPTSGFLFDSPDSPGAASFTASLYDSNFNIYTISGSTLAPVVTPEPSSLYLLLFMAPACFLLNRRKAGKNFSVPETINPMETIHVSNN
jgi:hypothetical protein